MEKSRLELVYNNLKLEMQNKFRYSNEYEVPKLQAIILSCGFGKEDSEKKKLEYLTLISGQCAVATTAKKSIAGFGIREGMTIGGMVSLRRSRMYHFIDRLIVAMLNWSSFKGINPNSISVVKNRATLSIGIPDQKIFHEITEFSTQAHGLNITFVSNCKNAKELQYLLMGFGLPFYKKSYNKTQ